METREKAAQRGVWGKDKEEEREGGKDGGGY